MIWKGSWLHTQRIRARRLQMLAFPHTPQAGDRIPVGRPSRKLWWMSEQTTSSWWLRRLPSTFTPLTPSEEKPSLFLFYFPLFDLVALWHISIDNACLDCHAVFLVFFLIFLQDWTHLLIPVLGAQPSGWHCQALPQLGGSRPRWWPTVRLREAFHHTSGILATAQTCLRLHDCLLDQLCQNWVQLEHHK